MLHVVDIAPVDTREDPVHAVQALERELGEFSTELAEKPRWLVLNKIDLLDDETLALVRQDLLEKLDWKGPVFDVSAATGEGTEELAKAVMRELEFRREADESEA